MENSTFVTDAELTEYLNQELAELHGRLTANEGQPHFRSQTTITVTAGTSLYGLPADFWKVHEITCTYDGIVRPMEPFMPHERAALQNTQIIYPYTFSPRYRVQGDNLEILPANRNLTVTLFYVRACPRVSGADTIDGFNGYEIAAIHGVCATVLEKEGSDFSFYSGMKDRIYRQIDVLAAQRDASRPERVVDVVGMDDLFPLSSMWK